MTQLGTKQVSTMAWRREWGGQRIIWSCKHHVCWQEWCWWEADSEPGAKDLGDEEEGPEVCRWLQQGSILAGGNLVAGSSKLELARIGLERLFWSLSILWRTKYPIFFFFFLTCTCINFSSPNHPMKGSFNVISQTERQAQRGQITCCILECGVWDLSSWTRGLNPRLLP